MATWNVNSLKARLPRVEEWLSIGEPDVLCMQETKLADSAFPAMTFSALGYEAVHVGEGRWNGVAILSRVGLDDVVAGFHDGAPVDAEARLVSATCGGVRVATVYVPNGRSIDHEQYTYKLEWLGAASCAHRRDRRPRRRRHRVRRLQHRARRSRRVGPAEVHRRDPHEPGRARRARRARAVGARRRLPQALRRRPPLLLVGLPGRQLPRAPRHAHRPHAREPAAGRNGCEWALIDRNARKGSASRPTTLP